MYQVAQNGSNQKPGICDIVQAHHIHCLYMVQVNDFNLCVPTCHCENPWRPNMQQAHIQYYPNSLSLSLRHRHTHSHPHRAGRVYNIISDVALRNHNRAAQHGSYSSHYTTSCMSGQSLELHLVIGGRLHASELHWDN